MSRTLYRWFAASADRHPDAVALEVGDATMTYAELRIASDALAARILDAHGAPPARVALLALRSAVAFAGYLAALRLGAAVTPLNPGFPAERNGRVCAQVAADVLIADENGAAQLAAGCGVTAPVVLTPTDDEVLAAPSPESLPPYAGRPGDVAYILFTSGSTGRPKGVPITHANTAPYVERNIARFGVGRGSRLSHTFDLTFDPSVFDLFVAWGGGATLVAPQRSELLAPVAYLVERRITHWFSVPSVVSVGTNLGNLSAGPTTDLRHSVFIGEQLTYRQAAAWHAVAPGTPIDNVYGPTELTVACTEYRLPADPAAWPATSNDTVPIGPVHEFLDAVVVDDDGHPAAEGELCVRGSQRFAGYLDPRDNAGRFAVADGGRYVPATGVVPGPDHYYRTGDRVRWENGVLVHLGRRDQQVKILGYRVELGEIEAVLSRHPGVTQAVVVARPGDDGTTLAAFWTGTAHGGRALTRWLRDRLPLHMVPSRLCHRDSLPLNDNGKVDRGLLRDEAALA